MILKEFNNYSGAHNSNQQNHLINMEELNVSRIGLIDRKVNLPILSSPEILIDFDDGSQMLLKERRIEQTIKIFQRKMNMLTTGFKSKKELECTVKL